MTIKKQHFYEGAALHSLVCEGSLTKIGFMAPFFVLNDRTLAYIKYSTKGRSPWGFTVAPSEQESIASSGGNVVIAFVCGSDGVAAITAEEYDSIAAYRSASIHIACYRRHGEYYEVSGPDGALDRKIPPSRWKRILDEVGG